ncbi:hypothetical protein Scep_006402 [Stephania cephalantha]|uniref:Bowman-Birk serine protease inhibitors family domain-containing protein n=1 Tax=Stephania cephalantha TaxID=152367 RepID=A0AAP0KAM0_9MAGN
MGVLKFVTMAVVLVALLGASPPTVEARTNAPTIPTTSAESLENIDLDTVFVEESSDETTESNILSVVDSLGINDEGNAINCGGVACCNLEICTKSCPPQCRCMDKGVKCHAACKNCRCTKSIPPQCQCMDITHYTYGKCK